ncbi:MAG: helix-turn-helix transcriptional regulator [Chitinophagaceae bacterium]|nr:helix-turn-helix transcriptional regulator [Chitinophagaceae bacterium]
MNYQQIPPPEALRTFIRYFFILETDDIKDQIYTFRTVADGGPGLLFQPEDRGSYYQNYKQLPGLFLYGQVTTNVETSLKGKFSTIGIVFYPHVLKTIFGIDAGELTDTCMDVDQMARQQGFYLNEMLGECRSSSEKIEILSSYLLFLAKRNNTLTDTKMEYALSRILQSKGNISLKELNDQLCLSERSVERKFKQYVGLSPKMFARICRFQASLDQIRNNKYSKLSDIAYENEYADQSHLIRAFKEFAGVSPKQAMSIMENIAGLTIQDSTVASSSFLYV